NAQILGALGNFNSGELLHTERVGPVVGHRTKIVEPVGVGHRAEVTGVLANFLMIAMQITEDRLKLTNHLAVEGHIHPKYAVCRRVLRSHRHFEQLAFQARTHAHWWPLECFNCFNCRAHANCEVKKLKGYMVTTG